MGLHFVLTEHTLVIVLHIIIRIEILSALVYERDVIIQGLFELGGGVGYSLGPAAGGALYEVRTVCCHIPYCQYKYRYLNSCQLWKTEIRDKMGCG